MKRETRLMSLLLASACFVSTLSAGSVVMVSSADAGSEHETLTMSALAPFRNPSRLLDLVHEKYPEINIEFEPYSGYNATAYTKEQLEDAGNEQKKEDALHVMEVLCTVEGMHALTYNENTDVLIPLKDYVIPDDSIYKTFEDAINNGYVAPYIYSGWENMSVDVGEKMMSFMRGECDIDEVAEEIDESQHLLFDNSDLVYTTVTEEISVEDCAKMTGICFAKASGADVALVSTNKWFDTDADTAMNTRGVQCPLYALPITDQEITAMLPTGWTGTIQTVTLTGARIKELAETGFDKFDDGEHLFPYTLVTPDGFTLEDDTTYTVAICGASESVQEEGDTSGSALKGLRFLCAEDNALNAEILEALLEMSGAGCTICSDGVEIVKAFENIRPGDYDAILMDVQMPNMNGIEATRAIRRSANPLAKTISIIAMTANAFSEDVQRCLDAGMDVHMARPINMATLEKVVKKLRIRGTDSRQ